MKTGAIGKVYKNGEVIVRQGDEGNCMYVVQAGQVEVVREEQGRQLTLGVLNSGDFFGEMALFEREPRAATVRSLGETQILTIDQRTFLGRVQEDPSLAFRLVEKMSQRIRELNNKLAQADGED